MRHSNFYLQSFKIYNLHDDLNTQNYYFEQVRTTSSSLFSLSRCTLLTHVIINMLWKIRFICYAVFLLLSNLHCKYNLALVVPTSTSIQLTSISCRWLFCLLYAIGYCSQCIDWLMLTNICNWRDAVCNRLCLFITGVCSFRWLRHFFSLFLIDCLARLDLLEDKLLPV